MLWQGTLWLIDHGAAMYFHHIPSGPEGFQAYSENPFPLIKDHVLLPFARALAEADIVLRERLTIEIIDQIVDAIPDTWLAGAGQTVPPTEYRAAYSAYLWRRLEASDLFLQEAIRAQH